MGQMGQTEGRPAPPKAELTEQQEWAHWRRWIGAKRVCDTCGAIMGQPAKHAEWHAAQS